MRSKISKIALTAAIALAVTFSLDCEKKSGDKTADSPKQATEEAADTAQAEAEADNTGGSNVKLPESAIDDNGGHDCVVTEKLEYDAQNRIVKKRSSCMDSEGGILNSSTTAITYNADDLITVERAFSDNSKRAEKFVRKGNTVTVESETSDTITINNDGYIVKNGNKTYKYKGGNLTELKNSDYGFVYDKFDDKKAPFSNCATPKWLLQYLFDESSANKNNALGISFVPEPEEGMAGDIYDYEYDGDGFPTKERSSVEGDPRTKTYTYRGDRTGAAR